jgi:hypothetical protein
VANKGRKPRASRKNRKSCSRGRASHCNMKRAGTSRRREHGAWVQTAEWEAKAMPKTGKGNLSIVPRVDLRDEEQVRAYFARVERDYPQLIEAMKVMNISYQEYLAAMRAMSQRSSISTSSAKLTL